MNQNKNRNRYALYGALFGLCFPIIGSIIQCYVSYMDISIKNLIMIQKDSPLLWIIDTAPLFLGLFASFGGIQLDKLAEKNQQLSNRYEEMKRLRIVAEEANQAKSTFLAKMSHEIRTPMNAVLGLTYLSLKEDLTPKVEDNLKKIDRSGKSLLNIINDILDFSKIEAGEFNIENRAFIFEDMITEVIDVMNVKMKDKNQVEFVCDYDNSIPKEVISDSSRIKQILINLLNNAIKFTDKGEIILKCRTNSTTKDDLFIDFEVIDTGVGIDKAKQAEIFDPFKQEDDSTTRKYGGTGLGLVITKSLVELLGGQITVESEKGKGAKFKFSIQAKKVGKVDNSSDLVHKNLNGLRVLLVDDSDTSRNTLHEILESFKFNVFSASSGEEGISIFLEQKSLNVPIDLIIADWYMPEMDGLEMIDQLKAHGNEQSVLMVTAYGAQALRQAKQSNQIDSYLLKPISPSILFDSIQQALSKKSLKGIDGENENEKLIDFRSKLNGFHVLIVEDNEINRELIIELLLDVGITCDIATNGSEGLDMAQKKEYASILMDIQMPVMDGLTASREMRKIQKLKEIPIIAMTAHAMVGEREKSLGAGMNEHITKPINPKTLYETLCTFLLKAENFNVQLDQKNDLPSDAVTDFPSIPGVDVQDGLSRAGSRIELYIKLLSSFLKKYKHSGNEINEHWKNLEYKNLMEVLHTIGGVAGNIGAKQLSKDMLRISGILKKDKEEHKILEGDIESIVDMHNKLIESIDHAISNYTLTDHQIDSKDELKSQNNEALIDELITKITSKNPKSIQLAKELSKSKKFSEEEQKNLKQVLENLEEFDFENALIKLKEFK